MDEQEQLRAEILEGFGPFPMDATPGILVVFGPNACVVATEMHEGAPSRMGTSGHPKQFWFLRSCLQTRNFPLIPSLANGSVHSETDIEPMTQQKQPPTVRFTTTLPASWQQATVETRLRKSLPTPTWPMSNGRYEEHLTVHEAHPDGPGLQLFVSYRVDFDGTNPAFDGPWTQTTEYEVWLPPDFDSDVPWNQRKS